MATDENKPDEYALKTVCGAIHYIVTRYSETEIGSRDWECLCSYAKIPKETIYCLEVFKDGFLLTTKAMSLKYRHSDFHEKRVIEFA